MGWGVENKTPNQLIEVGIACTHEAIHTAPARNARTCSGEFGNSERSDTRLPSRNKKRRTQSKSDQINEREKIQFHV
jgi:hypothetical protein